MSIFDIKKITNNGSNPFYVNLFQYDKVKLNGYLRSDGYDLFNGVIYVELTIFIKDLDGNNLDVIYLENERRQITTKNQTGKGTIFKTVNETIPLSQYKKYNSIIVDVYAYTQAEVGGVKGEGISYSHDINLKLDLIEIPKQVIPITPTIPKITDVVKTETKVEEELPFTTINPYYSLIPLGVLGVLLLYTRGGKS